MYKTIKESWKRDIDLPERAYRLEMLNRVLDGTLYDQLPYPFHMERTRSNEYIPLHMRRPNTRFNVVRSVVDDAASLLFSESHFPKAKHADKHTREALARLIKETNLNEIYLDACVRGSVGSVAILMRVLKGRLFFEVRPTTYLTPAWDPLAPDTLKAVTELYKVRGSDLMAGGYEGNYNPAASYWLKTVWNGEAETTFLPVAVKRENDEPIKWIVDADRSITHNLGFVPIDWIKNLPGGDAIDGEPTMKHDAIETSVSIDYLASQNGRGLKYSLDPTLVIKESAYGNNNEGAVLGQGNARAIGAGNAIVVDSEGDAKLLESSGSASDAVINFLRMERELALESLKGNRASAEKMATAQSGKALELLNQTLVWLADRLRISYGEKSLHNVLQLIITVSRKVALVYKDGTTVGELAAGNIALSWPSWYSPTPVELQQTIETLARAVDAGIISRESAIAEICALYDIEDVAAETTLIKAELEQREAIAQTQVKVTA